MGQELCGQFPKAKQVFQEAEDVLGFSLSRLCFSGPESELKLTENTQPAILTVSVAALRVLESETPWRPVYVAGHSLGEYSALVCVGAISFRDAVRVVRERGRFMQAAVPAGDGAMAVVMGLEMDAVHSVCEEASEGDVVAPANYNGGGQIVIAGAKKAVARALSLAKTRGAKRVLELPVSAPFHCPLMRPAADALQRVLSDVVVHPFTIGVVTNVDAEVNFDTGRVKPLLTEQAVKPVRWEESVRKLEELDVSEVLEVGPGKVLKGLVKRISPKIIMDNFETPQDLLRVSGSGVVA
ncbi:MAG: ACP S-malonyltransferase [Deltaproteobacteria bacterium]|nr:ACP S-malonyltransferase [Deltaproteobacteria bacterium]